MDQVDQVDQVDLGVRSREEPTLRFLGQQSKKRLYKVLPAMAQALGW